MKIQPASVKPFHKAARPYKDFARLIKHYIVIHNASASHYLASEGQEWQSLRGGIAADHTIHAIKFHDGREFDLVSGFRPRYPSRGELQRPIFMGYMERESVRHTHVKLRFTHPPRWELCHNNYDKENAQAFRFSNGMTWDPVDGWCDKNDLMTDEWMEVLSDLGLADMEPKPTVKASDPKSPNVFSTEGVTYIRLNREFLFDKDSMIPLWCAQLIGARMIHTYGINKVMVDIPNLNRHISTGDAWLVKSKEGKLTIMPDSEIRNLRNE